jgi:ribosomal protein S18 acetylase RimI-like enzyme
MGLYDQDDKLVAQSFVWHNQGTIVLDNIEGQRGRNLGDIQGRYNEALTEYLVKLDQEKPELGIRQVNVGLGYINSAISEKLTPTEAVPLPDIGNADLYSDAHYQRMLVRLTDEDLAKLKATPMDDVVIEEPSIEPQTNKEAKPEIKSISSIADDAQTISRIEAQVYPNELALGQSEILADLQRPNNFSFMIGSRSGNSSTVGYMLAYHDEDADGIYVSDLAFLADEQRNGYGAAAMDHLLSLARDAGENRIVFDARETTSYLALQSPTAAFILAKYGFQITNTQHIENFFDNGEGVYQVVLETQPELMGIQ